MRAIVELPKPVIARVDGHVRAGGLGLVGACDIAVAGPARRSRSPRCGSASRRRSSRSPLLPRMTARAAARYYLTGETFDAAERPQRIGLIDRAADDVDAAAEECLDALRACLAAGPGRDQAADHRRGAARPSPRTADGDDRAARRGCSPPREAREGMRAFLERRARRLGRSERSTATREPQQDRSRATRAPPARGGDRPAWPSSAGPAATVTVVAERAGVSRGAAQHHFPTREDLFTAAVEHVAAERRALLRAELERLPAPGPRAPGRSSS